MSFKKNISASFLGSVLPLLVALVAIPYLLKNLGAEKFGLLTLIWSLIGYFGVFDLGIGRALTFEVSRRSSDGGKSNIARIIKSGSVFTLLTGILGGIAIYFFVAPRSVSWFGISKTLSSDAILAFQIAALGIVPTTITSGVRGALEGLNRFVESNLNRLILGIAMFVAPAICIYSGYNELWEIALCLVGLRFLVLLQALWQIREFLLEKAGVTLSEIKLLLSYGSWVTISGLISPLMVYGDRFFVSAAVGAQKLSLYSIPQEGLQRVLIIPAALAAALMPVMSSLKKSDEFNRVYYKNLKRTALIMAAICAVVFVAAHPFLGLWIGPAFADDAIKVVYVIVIGIWFNSMAQISMTAVYAAGRPKFAALTHIVELCIYIVMIYFLSKYYGVLGAALAWVLRVFFDFIALHFIASRRLGVNLK